MSSNNNLPKNLEVSLGLFVGYGLGALANVLFFDKNWKEAMTDPKLVSLFAGILLATWLWRRKYKKADTDE